MRSVLLWKKAILLQVQRKEIESHLQEAVRPHVDLAFAKLTSTQEELKRSQDLTSKLSEKFNGLESQLKLLEAKFNDQQLIIRRLSSNDHGKKINTLERNVGTFQTQLNKKAVELENSVKDNSKKIDSLEKSFRLLQRPLNPIPRVVQKESTFTRRTQSPSPSQRGASAAEALQEALMRYKRNNLAFWGARGQWTGKGSMHLKEK